MSFKFYRNRIPTAPVYLTGVGVYVKFDQVSDEFGVMATGKENVQADLEAAARQGISGIEEISEDEYKRLLDSKKNWTPSKRQWREEFSLAKVAQAAETNPDRRQVPEPYRTSQERKDVAERVKLTSIQQTTLPDEHRPVVRRRK